MGEELGARLKEVRKALGCTQSEVAELAGSTFSSWQQYEGGRRTPGSQVIAGLVAHGINANWVLTGEGPMMLEQLGQPSAPEGKVLDEQLLRLVIEAVEEALEILDLDIDPPAKKADLILAIYEMYDDTGVQPDAAKVIRLVKTAA